MQQGIHNVRATGSMIGEDGDVRFGKSSGGTDQVAVRMVVEDGVCAGETLWWIGSLPTGTPKAAEAIDITVRGLRSLGARLADGRITDLAGLGEVVTTASVKEEEYQGKKKWKVSVGGGNFRFTNALDAGGVAALEERLRGGIVAAAQKAGGGRNGAGGGDLFE